MQTFKEYYSSNKGKSFAEVYRFKDTKRMESFVFRPETVGTMVLQKFGSFRLVKDEVDKDFSIRRLDFTNEGDLYE